MCNELEVNDEPPDTEVSQVVTDKVSRRASSGNLNTFGFLRGVSLRQGTIAGLCGFDGVANHILHDWGTNNVVGVGADKER